MEPDGRYLAVTTKAQLIEVAKVLGQSDRLAVDTETTGLDINTCHLLGISITHEPLLGYWIPLDKSTLPDLNYQLSLFEPIQDITIEDLQKYLGPLLTNPNIKKYFHNIKFDIPLLQRYEFEINNYFDTMLGAWILGNKKGRKFGLKALTKEKFGIEQKELRDLLKIYKNFHAIPLELATLYAGADADMTFRHAELIEEGLTRVPSLKETIKMEHELAMVLYENEQTGILVNKNILQQRAEDLDADIREAKAFFHYMSNTNEEEFNPASPSQILGLLRKTTNRGDLKSTAYEFLQAMDNEYGLPWVEPLLKLRDLSKTKSTFVEGIYNRLRSDNRLATSFRQQGIATGRLSSHNPNLQNIPKQYRDVFIVPEDSYMVAVDFSGMELRILATLAQEQKMLEAFNSGVDVHSLTASLVFNKPYDSIGKKSKERGIAKTVGFGLCYGMSKFKLARTVHISIDEAEALLNRYFEIFTGVRDYMTDVHGHLMSHGWIENVYGRRRYFPVQYYAEMMRSNDYKDRKVGEKMIAAFKREAGNFPIQSLNAEITKRSLIECHKLLKESYQSKQVSSIHDEIIWEVRKDEMDELVPKLIHIMENIYPLDVPTIAEIGLGKNMAEACLDEENWELYLQGAWK